MKENRKIKNWLKVYKVPEHSPQNVDDVILKGKQIIDSYAFDRTSFKALFISQLQYFPLSFWGIQFLLFLITAALILCLGHLRISLNYPLTVLSIVTPVIVLLGANELTKSRIYDMWEIEQACKNQLQKVIACRMLIIGLMNLFLLTGILMPLSYYYRESLIGLILYINVPFNISCSSYLLVSIKANKADTSYRLIVCSVCLIIVFNFLIRQQYLFEMSMIWVWSILYAFSMVLLGSSIQRYIKYEKMIGELIWNLQ